MNKSTQKKYWDNDKSRALRALTMRLTRLNRKRIKISEKQYRGKYKAISQARDEIYNISKIDFTTDDRDRIFMKHGLMPEV